MAYSVFCYLNLYYKSFVEFNQQKEKLEDFWIQKKRTIWILLFFLIMFFSNMGERAGIVFGKREEEELEVMQKFLSLLFLITFFF